MQPRGNCGNTRGSAYPLHSECDGVTRLEHSPYVTEWSDSEARPKPVGHEDLNSNWVGAGHLKVGDKIKQADGTTGVVANVLTLQQTREMFNLTVSEAHTYYVGNDGWLVHNCDTIIDPDKFKYFFGSATGAKNAAHNAPRTAQNAQELARLGIHDTPRGHQWLQEQLEAAAGRTDNIREVFKDEFGSYEVRETLLAGPSGKFSRMKSTWEILPSGSRRITTVIIQGGKK